MCLCYDLCTALKCTECILILFMKNPIRLTVTHDKKSLIDQIILSWKCL